MLWDIIDDWLSLLTPCEYCHHRSHRISSFANEGYASLLGVFDYMCDAALEVDARESVVPVGRRS